MHLGASPQDSLPQHWHCRPCQSPPADCTDVRFWSCSADHCTWHLPESRAADFQSLSPVLSQQDTATTTSIRCMHQMFCLMLCHLACQHLQEVMSRGALQSITLSEALSALFRLLNDVLVTRHVRRTENHQMISSTTALWLVMAGR